MSWRGMASLKKKQKAATAGACPGLALMARCGALPMPLLVTITRIGPRRLDDDNLAGACKYVRDAIATEVGVDDGDERWTWRCEQRIGKAYGVDVEITSR